MLNKPDFTLFYICCNFGQICCTEVIQFFSVENLGHEELKKSSKYELLFFLDEKPRVTFANFLHLCIQGPPLTHSAMWRYTGQLQTNMMITKTPKQRDARLYFPVPAHNWGADVGGRVIKASWGQWVGGVGDKYQTFCWYFVQTFLLKKQHIFCPKLSVPKTLSAIYHTKLYHMLK